MGKAVCRTAEVHFGKKQKETDNEVVGEVMPKKSLMLDTQMQTFFF